MIFVQEISSTRKGRSSDYCFKILILQTVTVAVILVTALGVRIFGGEFYNGLSIMYHEKFDDITLSQEVLEPKNPVEEGNSQPSEVSKSESESEEGPDNEIEGNLSGNIIDFEGLKSTSVSSRVNSFLWPVYGVVSSDYGYRTHPISGEYTMHNGIDIASEKGKAISSAFDGVVKTEGYSNSYGYYIIVTHSDNVETLYAHCSKIIKSKGDTVKKGDTIALVGSTGRSTGPHVHFEVRVGGYRINPNWMLSDVTEV